MKKLLLFLLLCGIGYYLYVNYVETDTEDEPEATYNGETYDPNEAFDPNDEDAYRLYRWDGED